jgi:hypothetical protein
LQGSQPINKTKKTALTYWFILGVLAFISLVVSLFIGKNAIWGGLFIGLVAATLWTIIKMIQGHSFPFYHAGKIVTIAILAGALLEICSRISSWMMRK